MTEIRTQCKCCDHRFMSLIIKAFIADNNMADKGYT